MKCEQELTVEWRRLPRENEGHECLRTHSEQTSLGYSYAVRTENRGPFDYDKLRLSVANSNYKSSALHSVIVEETPSHRNNPGLRQLHLTMEIPMAERAPSVHVIACWRPAVSSRNAKILIHQTSHHAKRYPIHDIVIYNITASNLPMRNTAVKF